MADNLDYTDFLMDLAKGFGGFAKRSARAFGRGFTRPYEQAYEAGRSILMDPYEEWKARQTAPEIDQESLMRERSLRPPKESPPVTSGEAFVSEKPGYLQSIVEPALAEAERRTIFQDPRTGTYTNRPGLYPEATPIDLPHDRTRGTVSFTGGEPGTPEADENYLRSLMNLNPKYALEEVQTRADMEKARALAEDPFAPERLQTQLAMEPYREKARLEERELAQRAQIIQQLMALPESDEELVPQLDPRTREEYMAAPDMMAKQAVLNRFRSEQQSMLRQALMDLVLGGRGRITTSPYAFGG